VNHDKSKLAWKYRRRYVIWVTSFTMAFMVYAVERLQDMRLAETIVQSGFTLIGAITASYVFGAVWDHKNAREQNGQPTDVSANGQPMDQA
jgi:hypothetical protein